jgi:hypothetical protein
MRTRTGGRSTLDREAAEIIAAQGLAFLTEDRARLHHFLRATGLEPADLRARAGAPDMLLAVLEHLAGDESLLLVFAQARKIAPESIGHAVALLQGTAQ